MCESVRWDIIPSANTLMQCSAKNTTVTMTLNEFCTVTTVALGSFSVIASVTKFITRVVVMK